MYNRYIPQPDGSHYRKRVPEPPRQEVKRQPAPQPPPPCPPPPEPVYIPKKQSPPRHHRSEPQADNILGFFKNLLPQGIETADLLIVLLLLLMAGDNEESKNNALLTLALYFFM